MPNSTSLKPTPPIRRGRLALAIGAWCATFTAPLHAQTVAECRALPASAERLACYDRLFGPPAAQPAAVVPAPEAAGPANAATPATAASPGTAVPDLPVAPPGTAVGESTPEPRSVGEAMATTWELTPETKRGTFVVRTYLPNFLLPAHVTSRLNPQPSSPRLGLAPRHDYRHLGAKLQISLRAKVAEGLLLPQADLWFAYTQVSMWQLWNRKDSAPFRSTDYQPEAIYVVPVPRWLGELPAGWRWQMAQLGLAHQSNGQSEPLSRSWNRVYLAAGFERGELGLSVRADQRLGDAADDDDNPDLTDYLGTLGLTASWLPGRAVAQLNWRTRPGHLDRGAWTLDWTYPVDPARPAGLRWYVQLFSGYGETLLDYNRRQTSLGLGFTLFQL
ncbi:MAG: phospholipase A [Burkholderiales bacterium]|nr:phospholipase A [Burkholderiales bacterium]